MCLISLVGDSNFGHIVVALGNQVRNANLIFGKWISVVLEQWCAMAIPFHNKEYV